MKVTVDSKGGGGRGELYVDVLFQHCLHAMGMFALGLIALSLFLSSQLLSILDNFVVVNTIVGW